MILSLLLLLACGGPDATAPSPAAPAVVPETQAPPSPKLKVGTLGEDDLESGCSCTFSFDASGPGSGVVLSGDVNDEAYAIRVGKNKVSTKLAEVEADGTRVFRGGSITLRTKVTEVVPCTPGDLDCEGETQKRAVTVEGPAGLASFGVVGGCGC